MKAYQQLTYEQRCQLYALNKTGFSQQKIALAIGVNQATISRELKRNTGKRGYRYKQAQEKTNIRRSQAVKAIKMTPLMIELIESKLRENWSPEKISGLLLKMQQVRISYESIYIHVWRDKHTGGNLYQHLRRQGKKYQSRGASQAGRGHIKNSVSIHDRPTIIDERGRVANWEIDLIIGKGHSGAL